LIAAPAVKSDIRPHNKNSGESKMKKAELISRVADQAQVTKVEAEKTLNALIHGIADILQTQENCP